MEEGMKGDQRTEGRKDGRKVQRNEGSHE
jgi:hypothetical protein